MPDPTGGPGRNQLVALGRLVTLGRGPRRRRMIAAGAGLLLITAGTLYGSDDDFPAGPLRMYSVRDDPNGTVRQAVVQAVTAGGRPYDVTDTRGAPRRAELEGRFGELADKPAEFAAVAVAFLPSSGRVGGATVVQIRLVQRSYPLHDGRSGPAQDHIVATWTVPT